MAERVYHYLPAGEFFAEASAQLCKVNLSVPVQ